MARTARNALSDKKGIEIVLLDVRDMSSVTDFYLIVTSTSPPHMKAMLNEVQRGMKQTGMYCYRSTGHLESGWVVLDYIDVVIHIFSPDARQRYALENLWESAPRVE